MSSTLRYARLFLYFVRFSASKALEFRADFFFRVVMDCLYYAVNIGFYRVLFEHFPAIGGWNEKQAMIFVAGYLVVDALNMTLFSNNLWMFPVSVNQGDLDYHLVRPVSTLFFVGLRDFAFNSFLNLMISLGILAWAIGQYPDSIGPIPIAGFLVLLLNGAFLLGGLGLLFTLPVFWTHSVDGFRDLSWSLTKVMEKPDRIFTGVGRLLFTTVLPYCLIASFPARVLVDSFDWQVVLKLSAVTVFFWFFVGTLWRYGLKNYSSASS